MHYKNYSFLIFCLMLYASGKVYSQYPSGHASSDHNDVETFITRAKLNVTDANGWAYMIGSKKHGISYFGKISKINWEKIEVKAYYDLNKNHILEKNQIKGGFEIDGSCGGSIDKTVIKDLVLLYSTTIYDKSDSHEDFKHNSPDDNYYYTVKPGKHSGCINSTRYETDSRPYFSKQAVFASQLAKDQPNLKCYFDNEDADENEDGPCKYKDGIIDIIIEVTVYPKPELELELDEFIAKPSHITVSVPGVDPIRVSHMNEFSADALIINTKLAAQVIEKPKYYDEFKKDKVVDYAALTVRGDVIIARKSPHFPSIDGDAMPYTEHFGLYLAGGGYLANGNNNDFLNDSYNGAMLTADMALVPHDIWGNLIPDFVFKEDYNLPSLSELDHFVTTNKHLPHVPNQADLDRKGFYNVNEMLMGTLRNLEELYLHTIRQHHTLEKFRADTHESLEKINQLENRINNLKEKIK